MGKKLRNKMKLQSRMCKHLGKHHQVYDLINLSGYFDLLTSNSKRDGIEEKTANDFISNLSDDLLQHILSFLPVRDAVGTGSLSNRWRGLWKTELETTQQDGTVEEICREIGFFLNDAHERGISTRRQEFSSLHCLIKHSRRLQFNFGHSSFLLATVGPNGTLHLDFYTEKNESPVDFEWCLITNYYLRMTSWFKSRDSDNSAVSPFNSIRTIHLTAVTNLTSVAVSSMISKFQFLESLIIKECPGLHSLYIDAGHRFSHLMVFDCLQLKSLHINNRKIDKFQFRGLLPSFTCLDSLGLEDAMLDCRGGPGCEPFTYWPSESLLSSIRCVRILTLCRWTFEAEIQGRQIFKFQRLKELQWIDNAVDKHSIDALISFLKHCSFLQKLYINIDPTSYSSPRTRYSTQVFDCERLRFLEIIQLEGVIKECERALLANRLLDVATKKTEIIAKSYDKRIWKLEEVSLCELWQLCKAKIESLCEGKIETSLLKEGMKHYMFVEVNEEESSKVCWKHDHADL